MDRSTIEALLSVSLSSVFAVFGQLFLKIGMNKIGEIALDSPIAVLSKLFTSFKTMDVLIGFILYAAGAMLWMIALSKVDLSYAYPFVILAYMGVILVSWLFLKESIPVMRGIGIFVILLGTILVAVSYKTQ